MKTFKEIYQFPLRKSVGSWIIDSKRQMIMQFVPRFDDGDFAEGWLDFEEQVLKAINGEENRFARTFKHDNGHIYIEADEEPILIIRGWGNLTGRGAHNLPAEEAANIQDTFAEYIVERLNSRI